MYVLPASELITVRSARAVRPPRPMTLPRSSGWTRTSRARPRRRPRLSTRTSSGYSTMPLTRCSRASSSTSGLAVRLAPGGLGVGLLRLLGRLGRAALLRGSLGRSVLSRGVRLRGRLGLGRAVLGAIRLVRAVRLRVGLLRCLVRLAALRGRVGLRRRIRLGGVPGLGPAPAAALGRGGAAVSQRLGRSGGEDLLAVLLGGRGLQRALGTRQALE